MKPIVGLLKVHNSSRKYPNILNLAGENVQQKQNLVNMWKRNQTRQNEVWSNQRVVSTYHSVDHVDEAPEITDN